MFPRVVAALFILTSLLHAQVYEKIFGFTDARSAESGDRGSYPRARLVQGRDGNYYGTTDNGGASNVGTVFRMTPSGVLTTLVEFTSYGASNKGSHPSRLVQGRDGNFYGTTINGGTNNSGTIFKVTPGGILTTLVNFDANGVGIKGSLPQSGLVLGGDGNFYGTTSYGGISNKGTVFRMTPGGVLTTLVEFTGQGGKNKGRFPLAGLVQGNDGSFYGTTCYGGEADKGTVFKITRVGVMTTLSEFTGNGADNKGSHPRADLVQGSNGKLYGTTSNGGVFGHGTVFRISSAGGLTTLVNFTNNGANNKGSLPLAGLVQGTDGNLYGTTFEGGAAGKGTAFRMTAGGVLTTLVEFTGNRATNKGSHPQADLVQGSDGSLYGTSVNGGPSGYGTVFRMTTDGVVTMLVNFTDNGAINIGRIPSKSLVQGSDGNFYGTTGLGGSGNYGLGFGTVFKMTPGGAVTTLVRFNGNGATNKGSYPSGLVEGKDGSFYGTTAEGGKGYNGFGLGTVFKITPDGVLTTLVEFTGKGGDNKGSSPEGGLVLGKDGNFYGTTRYGGGPDSGTVFKMTPAGVLTTLAEFTGKNGSSPQAGLVQGKDGKFYGTTYEGGAAGKGTVFRMTPSGALTTLVEFTGNGASNKGRYPLAGLVQGRDGNFYGTTSDGDGNFYETTYAGGESDAGTVFKMTPRGVLTTLVKFTDSLTRNKGRHPQAGLVQGRDGSFYGTTSGGGEGDNGTVFKITSAGVLTTLVQCVSPENHPLAPLILATDGSLYGTVSGPGGVIFGTDGSVSVPDGAVFRLLFPGTPLLSNRALQAQGTSSAVIQTDVNARGHVTSVSAEYGSNGINFPNSVPVAANISGFLTKIVGTTLSNLDPGSTFYYRFRAVSSAGTTVSSVQSFTTLADPVSVVTAADSISPTSAVLNGTVNARNYTTKVSFEWSADANFSASTVVPSIPGTVEGGNPSPVNVVVAGLTKGQTYFYRIIAINKGGTTVSGSRSLTTLTEPIAYFGAAAALSTTRAEVSGSVDPRGSSAEVSFEYGTDGINFPNSFSAIPASVAGSDPVAVTATLTGLKQGTTYYCRLRGTGPGGMGLSETSTFSLGNLSGLVQVFPDPPQPASGTVTVNINPPIPGDAEPPPPGAWRFAGETAWRSSGMTATKLASGQRLIEFLPIPGYIPPPIETVDVVSGINLVFDRFYFETDSLGSGGLTVHLKPDEIAGHEVAEAARAQWRFVGASLWNDSDGPPVGNLTAGSYLVECKPVDGRVTPPVASVSITDGSSSELTLTYFTNNDTGAAAPVQLPFSSVSVDEDLPFAYVGQIRSEVGSSTGFVVKRRVVATAGHVVFDDGSLSYITSMQWLFQQHSGQFEPKPQVPRGSYLATGYADQRIADNSPGEGSPQSQKLDYAALYFLEEAGRGGYGGYLASDSGADNEYLDSSALKILAGYAVDGIPAADNGKLHATAAFDDRLTPIPSLEGVTWTTTAVRGFGGCSGGPLFVQQPNGLYFPAAIYLGGSGQTVVRAIDSSVVDLFQRAEVSGNGGDNNTGGGITHSGFKPFGASAQPGALEVTIEPASARNAGAGWRLKPEKTYRSSGNRKSGLSAGNYRLQLSTVSGFLAPTQQTVTVNGGQLQQVTFTYAAATAPPIIEAATNSMFGEEGASGSPDLTGTARETWRFANFGTTANTGSSADTFDADGDGSTNQDEYAAGTNPNNSTDVFKVLTSTRTATTFTVTAAGKAAHSYVLERRSSLATGSWSTVTSIGPLASDSPATLTDSSPPLNSAFYRLRVSAP